MNRPNIAAVTPWLGQPSNVWMYRQFDQLSDQIKTIITWEYINQDQFPLPQTEVRLVPETYADTLRGIRRTIDAFVTRRHGGPRYGPGFVRWLRSQFVDCRAEAVLGQFGPWSMVAEQACRGLNLPAFVHFHGFDISTALNKTRYRRSIEARWHQFAGMICVAAYQRDYLLSLGFDPDSVALIPCGAPVNEISNAVAAVQQAYPRTDDEVRFLFIGRFTEKKDPLSVLRAFEACHRSHPNARLRMGGFGPLMDDCRKWLAEQPESINDAVSLLGKLSPTQVIDQLAQADALVQHSRTSPDGDKEGWPVSIGEAMAASLPIVATRHAGIVDQVVEHHNGLLCDEGDWQQMGADMTELAGNSSLRKKMGLASYDRILEFDSTKQIEQLRDFINRRTTGVAPATGTRKAA